MCKTGGENHFIAEIQADSLSQIHLEQQGEVWQTKYDVLNLKGGGGAHTDYLFQSSNVFPPFSASLCMWRDLFACGRTQMQTGRKRSLKICKFGWCCIIACACLCVCVCTDPAVTELLSSQDYDSTLLPRNPAEAVERKRETETDAGNCIEAWIIKVQSRCHSEL